MKRNSIIFSISALCLISAPAFAQQNTNTPPRPEGPNHFERMDTNHDGAITRDEARAAHSAMFATIDANHDNFLTREEFQAHNRSQAEDRRGKMRERIMERRIDTIDTDNNGTITRQEWNNAPQARLQAKQKMHEDRFNQIDANHDGQLSRAELDASRPQGQRAKEPGPQAGGQGPQGQMPPGQPPRPPRQNPDTNNDGKVSKSEWDAMPMALFERGDLNHDGRITREEAAQSARRMEGNIRQRFQGQNRN